MSWMLRGMACWPGWMSLWYRGELYSLLVAILFAVLLNIAILATLIWDQWLTGWSVVGLWGVLFVAAFWSLAFGSGDVFRGRASRSRDECDSLLAMAQRDYLRGDYLEAEASLHRILSGGQEDMEAALLMASILRRTKRTSQAKDWLERLERFDAAANWMLEIQKEKSLCSNETREDS